MPPPSRGAEGAVLAAAVQLAKPARLNRQGFPSRWKIQAPRSRRVYLGNGVFSHGGPHPVTPFTHTPQAEIRIGNNVVLNGTRFGCSELIEIGDDCILADCRIFDTDMHSIWPNRHSDEARVATAPVRLQRNVWVGAAAIILKGVTIGENSGVGAGATVSRSVPPNAVVAGNPARVVKQFNDDGPGASHP